eukprot:1178103-Prymnesium_polylepis.1
MDTRGQIYRAITRPEANVDKRFYRRIPARLAPRGRCADTRTSVATQAWTGRSSYEGGTGRLPIRPLNDTYPVPEAPQSREALEDLPTTRTPCQRHRRAA